MKSAPPPTQVWIVEDDRSLRLVLAAALREAGHAVREFATAEAMLAALADAVPDVVFSDVRMPGADGLDLLQRIGALAPQLAVIMMSAYTDIATTAAAYRHGAFDYLPKPFDLDQAVAAVRRALARQATPPAAAAVAPPPPALLGHSAPMRELFRAIGRVAASGLAVLIVGETGTGKELVARALHRESARAGGPFVALNTAAIPAELLESELFGHEAGAFTGATRRHAGRFEQAAGGTLLLDEIGDMPLSLQTRLLRVLAAGEFYRVGGRELLRADVRVIAATHQDLDARVARGEFRADLLHRLDVVRLEVPPLRARGEDVPLLAARFLADACAQSGMAGKSFAPAALEVLRAHRWPGNVRELENLCRRLAVLSSAQRIEAEELPAAMTRRGGDPADGTRQDWEAALATWASAQLAAGSSDLHRHARERFDAVLLQAALAAHGGHRQHAAQALGLGRNTLTRKLGSKRRRRDRE
ncbi:MAG: nitrogen regulation protein NR(I) [Dokdonella sp.]|uniref:nitrogen regulation protein NR(I) n=1 Tax=Dokdonella sp. TaxID=2291710 RepID=UPI0025BFCC1A|nr:nitrogen regulation protein NR(I) [Dokdonella sp.]MBX3700100.1 nitrogen regulation protein NR(I) [Dokdonella sp.]